MAGCLASTATCGSADFLVAGYLFGASPEITRFSCSLKRDRRLQPPRSRCRQDSMMGMSYADLGH
jgi:hypothetical protein